MRDADSDNAGGWFYYSTRAPPCLTVAFSEMNRGGPGRNRGIRDSALRLHHAVWSAKTRLQLWDMLGWLGLA